ncbi:RTA1-domain-containing protein [Mycena indigotica]|uniref:RTA1-domain-containing protein n=1 Tax=Mycena indigotica TaxID=2126181 RepID=A0A8H6SPY4_9AGAR|nr:RTA1-domain-containing protein [Mycena indigotica]KAF7301840.1 RTA1-domain-containing protein [Mycena indigotica]
MFSARYALTLLLLHVAAIAQAAPRRTLPRPENPFLDPKHDPYNPLRYIASNVLTAIALGASLLLRPHPSPFPLVLIVALSQTFMVRKWGAKFMLSMVIGCYTFALGIATRFGLHKNPESRGLYIVEYLFVVLSPCAFIAAEYVLLGRLAAYLRCDSHLLVSPRRITLVFILSDIITFLIQAAGGSVSISTNTLSTAETGAHIFLAGLVLQLVSFLVFTVIFIVFIYRVRSLEPATWAVDSEKRWYQDWRALASAMTLSFIGILTRSAYRVAELSQGYAGPLATNEGLFYGLDTLPLFIAISVYVFAWPGRYIGNGTPSAHILALKADSPSTVEPKE